jgi:16S rRNA (cytosine967-C5)-methyltransferase
MDKKTTDLAARIIRKSSRELPADDVLRTQLKAAGGLSRKEGAEVSGLVFGYYRWFGWLEQTKPIEEQIQQAAELARRFELNPASFSDAELTERSVPAWVKEELEVTEAWARNLQSEPRLWLRARPGQGSVLTEKLWDCEPFGEGALADTLEYCGEQDLFRSPEFHAGEFELQDISSQAVGLICGPQPGQTWWDACAGEGGKTLHFSDLMQNKGMIWASDRAAWRLESLKRRAARARVFNYRTRLWSGGAALPIKTRFDGVLVDAPCSGVGTWQRNPHARWTTTPEDVRELGQVQLQLLAHAAKAVKSGGRLIYAVCTLARVETDEVVEEFGRQFEEFEPVAMANPLDPKESAASRVVLWPQDYGGNGMFVAGWRRR